MQAARPIQAAIAEEYEFSDPDITVTLTAAQAEQAAGETESRELIELIRLLPFGVFQRFLPLDGLPSFSANVGKIETVEGAFEIHYAARSPFESCMDEAETTVSILCGRLNAEIAAKNDYYGYRYLKDSPLRDTMDRVFMAQYGKPLLHVAAHGGNECGAFKHMFPDMDIVTTGAIYAKHHTPEEYLDRSFDRSILPQNVPDGAVIGRTRRGATNMEFDLSKPYCFYFNEICKIRMARRTKALSDWLVDFARAHHPTYPGRALECGD
ncbi:MAG: hypothetical protein ACLVJB_02285 [Christensenellales bacterium]